MIAWLLLGLVLGAAFVGYARSRSDGGRWLFAAGLVVAALVYIGFAAWPPVLPWLGIESLGVAVFGTLAWLGLRVSPHWTAVGWVLHAVWDVALHYAGPGTLVAPRSYALVCLAFDLLAAAAIVAGFRSRPITRTES